MSNEVTIKLKSPFIWVNSLKQGNERKTHTVNGAIGIIKEFNQGGILFIVNSFIDNDDEKPIAIFDQYKNCGVWFFSYNQIEPINVKPIQI